MNIIYFILILLFIYLYSRKTKENMTNESYPKIRKVNNLLNKKDCYNLIKIANKKLKPSLTFDGINNARTSYGTFLNNNHPIIKKILKKIERRTKLSRKKFENIYIVKYKKGEKYDPHYDNCMPFSDKICKNDSKDRGYRDKTLVIYLTNNFEGGYTIFPLLGKKFKPSVGSGIIFNNLLKDGSNVHPLSLHGGEPIIKGVKYIVNIWIRQK